jgi:hypothetical protein
MVNAGASGGGGSDSFDYGSGRYVESGGRIRIVALTSLVIGAPIYAYALGVLGVLGDIHAAIMRALGGIETFFAGTIRATFASGVAAINLSWGSYWLAARDLFGGAAWPATVGVTFLSLYLFVAGVRRIGG